MTPKATFVSALVAALVACGGSSSSSTSVSAQQATTDAANAFCNRVQACAPTYVSLAYGDVTTCVARLSKSILPTIGANGSGTTPEAAEACAQAIPGASCSDALSRNLPAACHIAGKLADGSPCSADSQCVNQRCKVAPTAVCGACTSLAKTGDACVVDDDCVPLDKCIANKCVAMGSSGDACAVDKPCRADLGCRSGTCGAFAAVGEACTSNEDCDLLHGAACDPSTKKCVTIGFAPAGGTCGLVNGQYVTCAGPGGNCKGATLAKPQGTCAAGAADGAACDAVNGPSCESPAVCVNGTCTLPDPANCH